VVCCAWMVAVKLNRRGAQRALEDLPGAVILQEAAQRVGSMGREEPERLTDERPPEAAPGGLGFQEQGQEVAQHQGQERGQQDRQGGKRELPRHHRRPPHPSFISQAWSLQESLCLSIYICIYVSL
jgi:hypothetical protein